MLQKSRENKVTTEFFYELSQKLAMLLNEVRERSPSSSHVISDQIRCAGVGMGSWLQSMLSTCLQPASGLTPQQQKQQQ